MRRTAALRMLLRSPLKTMLTFALITVASFALFSRVIGYTITTHETARAESFYSGVAALDNAMPDITSEADVGASSGALLSSVLVTRRRIMELLQAKE